MKKLIDLHLIIIALLKKK